MRRPFDPQVRGTLLLTVLLALAPASATTAYAQLRTAQHAGAACFGYPPYRTDVVTPFQYKIFGLSQTAYCPIRIDDERSAEDLYLVFVYGTNLSGRLCLHAQGYWTRCGPSKSVGTSGTLMWLSPPSDTPGVPSGAFLQVNFPGGVSLINEYSALWSTSD